MTNMYIEAVSASLVREYLSRKGLKTTLQILDEEMPRSEDSISNRQLLVKELHIEKIMKKNKEQTTPLKAMLEVIAQYLLASKSGVPVQKNGELTSSSMQRANNTNGNGNNESSYRNASFASNTNRTSLLSKEETQVSFDGYPVSQEDQADDLLAPDPAFSYPAYKRKPRVMPGANTTKPEHKVGTRGCSDMVIEDSTEGETILGDGRSGVLPVKEEEQSPLTRNLQARTRNAVKAPRSVGLGMSGPITNTEDSSRRKFHKPRPLSASKNQRSNLFDSESSSKISSLENGGGHTPKPVVINSKPLQTNTRTSGSESGKKSGACIEDIDTLISRDRKKSISDVLDG